ncbi:YDG domain-containing protein, partial [Lentilitoribacter sp. EG35]|uniref:YDG domain-containing protein n=1 Tax=Lentilitoribacter sp. EG35 TaxID=3234192 RepID=UPI00345FE83B
LTANNKIYDATTNVTISGTASFGGLISGDTVSIDVGALNGSFGDKNVGTGKSITLSGVTLSGADAGNYTAATPTGLSADISAKALTVTGVVAANKVYDGTAIAALSNFGTLSGVVGGDAVTLDAGSIVQSFDNKNVGTNKDVTLSGYAIAGVDAGNYIVSNPTGIAANITARALTITANAGNKIYDGNTTATVTYGDNRISGDTLTIAGTGTFADKNAGTGKTVSVAGITLGGADAGNYTFNTTASDTADITPGAVTSTSIILPKSNLISDVDDADISENLIGLQCNIKPFQNCPKIDLSFVDQWELR